MLNQLSAWWFEQTSDIVANHLVSVPDPNLTVGRTAVPLPVEVVVRGYITGVTSTSLWQQYADGARTIYGYDLPDGLRKNTALPHAIVTPTTKAQRRRARRADHQRRGGPVRAGRRRSCGSGSATPRCSVFAFGQQTAAAAGLILADTKYEFGLAVDTGELLLIDEMHTPDSSRFWVADSYEAAAGRRRRAREPRQGVRPPRADRARLPRRRPAPALPADVVAATSARYISAYERITGQTFVPGAAARRGSASPQLSPRCATLGDRHTDSTTSLTTSDRSRQAPA